MTQSTKETKSVPHENTSSAPDSMSVDDANGGDKNPFSGVGHYLRSQRERKHYTIEQIASTTKINVKLLHALENEQFEILPAKPFLRGFVASYAKALSINADDVLKKFDTYVENRLPDLQKMGPPTHLFSWKDKGNDNHKTILGTLMFGMVVVGAIVFFIKQPLKKHRHKNHQVENIAPSTPETPATNPTSSQETPTVTASTLPEKKTETTPPPKSEPTATTKPEVVSVTAVATTPAEPKVIPTPPTPTPVSPPAPVTGQGSALIDGKLPPVPTNEAKVKLILRSAEDVWVKYQVDDRPVLQYTFKQGKTIWIRGRESIRFSTPKPDSIERADEKGEYSKLSSKDRLIILPESESDKYRDAPFRDPNIIYLPR